MVDRNLQVSYLIVDEMHHEHPELLKDQYWDEIFPAELPHTVASMKNKEEVPEASTANIDVSRNAAEVIPVVPSSVRVDEMVGKKLNATNYKFADVESLNDTDEVRQSGFCKQTKNAFFLYLFFFWLKGKRDTLKILFKSIGI
jgi:hypothetical protein